MNRGSEGSSSIFLRSHEMCTSSVFVGPNQCGSHTSSMIVSRRITSPALAINRWSRSNSFAASSTGSPSFVTVREEGSSRSVPISIGPLRAVPRPRRMMARMRATSSPAENGLTT